MAFFDDVLDATGRTPRELGAIHLFVESCVRSGTGEAVLTVCAPFEGFPGREVCAACDSLPAVQLERLARARRSTALVGLAHLGLFIVTVVVLAGLEAPGGLVLTILLALCVGLAGAQFKVNGVWPALLSLPLGLALLVVSTFALSSVKWGPGALLLWPLWFAVGATLLTMASTQRGQVRAIHASNSKG